MDKDNEIYVTSNGELYKKGVKQAIYPQTNYTIQQFYTKEEYDKLQAENEQLKFELKSEQKDNKYIKNCCIRAGKELEKHSFKWDGKEKNLVVQALELNEQYDKLQAENKELSESIKRLKNMAKAAALGREKYKYTLQEIRDICKNSHTSASEDYYRTADKIQDKINEVIGAE